MMIRFVTRCRQCPMFTQQTRVHETPVAALLRRMRMTSNLKRSRAMCLPRVIRMLCLARGG